MPSPRFFRSPKEFGRWLAGHHATSTEIWIGFYKKRSATPGMTYPEAVEEALCWGWIDTLVRGRDANSFEQRFTPRKPRSTWSLVNVARVERLIEAGRMRPLGLAAFEARDAKRTGIYWFEQTSVALSPDRAKRFRAARSAWRWFSSQGGSYQRAAIHWVNSAKREVTRERRFATLIVESAKGKKLRQYLPMAERDR